MKPLFNTIKNITRSIKNYLFSSNLETRKTNYTNAMQTIRGVIPLYFLGEAYLDIIGKHTLKYNEVAKYDKKLQAFMVILYELAQYVSADLKALPVDGTLHMPRFLNAAGFTSYDRIGFIVRLPIHKPKEQKRYITVQYTVGKDAGYRDGDLTNLEDGEYWLPNTYGITPIPLDTLLHYANTVNRNIILFGKMKRKKKA